MHCDAQRRRWERMRGMSLIGGLVALGISSIIAAGIAQMSGHGIKAQRSTELRGSLEAMPVAGIMRRVIITKNTRRKNMMSIIGMISMRPFFSTKNLLDTFSCLCRHG